MSVEVVTFGCRLNAYEFEVIRAHARRGRAHRRGGGQHLRGDRRGGAPGAAGDPQARAASGRTRASSSPAARRRPSRKLSPPCPKSTSCSATTKSSTRRLGRQRRAFRRSIERAEKRRRQRHHGGARNRAAPGRRLRGPRARLCAGAERLRPPLHLLHHSRSAAAIRARCRWARWSTQVRRLVEHGYREVVLTGVDLTSYGADLPGAPTLGALVKQILKHVPELPRLRLSSIDSVEADRRSARRARQRARG